MATAHAARWQELNESPRSGSVPWWTKVARLRRSIGLVLVWAGGQPRRQTPTVSWAPCSSACRTALLYALIALGYTMVYGIIELINFAHGDLFMLATIVAAAHDGHRAGGRRPERGQLLPLLVALIVCMAFGATVNVSIECFAYRRLRRRRSWPR